jgi:hypothetical protein
MALKPVRTEQTHTVGHVSHDAQVRVDKRVREILARQEAARAATSPAPQAPVTERSTAALRGGAAIKSRS